MHHVVELDMVVQQVGIVRVGGAHGDLVAQAPDHNAGMVVVLRHQLPHLGEGVLPAVRHVPGDVGNLRPDDQAPLVAQVVEHLVVLVVGQADGVRAHLADQVNVLPVMLGLQRVADAGAILVAAHAPQGIGLPVEEEALLRVDAEGAAAEADAARVQHVRAVPQFGMAGVQVGILPPVPQMHMLDGQHGLALAGGHGGIRHGLALVQQGDGQGFAAR